VVSVRCVVVQDGLFGRCASLARLLRARQSADPREAQDSAPTDAVVGNALPHRGASASSERRINGLPRLLAKGSILRYSHPTCPAGDGEHRPCRLGPRGGCSGRPRPPPAPRVPAYYPTYSSCCPSSSMRLATASSCSLSHSACCRRNSVSCSRVGAGAPGPPRGAPQAGP